MRPFPPSTNDAYSGSTLSAHFLTLFSVLTIVPGCIHTFAPDGGAGTIAGLDLSQNGRVIIAIFAWAGATQIAFGLAALIVSLRYRSLVPLMLGLAIVERALHALNAWVIKSAGSRAPSAGTLRRVGWTPALGGVIRSVAPRPWIRTSLHGPRPRLKARRYRRRPEG